MQAWKHVAGVFARLGRRFGYIARVRNLALSSSPPVVAWVGCSWPSGGMPLSPFLVALVPWFGGSFVEVASSRLLA